MKKIEIHIYKESKKMLDFYNDCELEIILNNALRINFIALKNDLTALVAGFLGENLFGKIKNLAINECKIEVEINHNLETIKTILSPTTLLPNCGAIEDAFIYESSAQKVPFNNSKTKLNLESYRKKIESFYQKNSNLFEAKIFENENTNELFASCSTPKTAIYKVIGKAIIASKKSQNKLLDSFLLINFALDSALMQIIILNKITFVLTTKKPSFYMLKMAQKFGVTLIFYDGLEFFILSHYARLV